MLDDDHLSLLHLVSLYTGKHKSIRKTHLIVILEYCTLFDSSPNLISIPGRSLGWINISHYAVEKLTNLIQHDPPLLVQVKQTNTTSPSISYQITPASFKSIFISQKIKDIINDQLYPEIPMRSKILSRYSQANLLRVSFDASTNQFFLFNTSSRILSTVTTPKELSFRSHSFCANSKQKQKTTPSTAKTIPFTIQPIHTNAFQLDSVVLLLSEWIPEGSNQMSRLCTRLGALDRCQNTFFSNHLIKKDNNKVADINFTKIICTEFDFARYINFQNSGPSTRFGMHAIGVNFNENGSILYGIEIDEVGESSKKENGNLISTIGLARIIAMIHTDTTELIEDLLTPVQQSLLGAVYADDYRFKYSLILAMDFRKFFLNPLEYYQNSRNSSELINIIGTIFHIDRLPENHLLFRGEKGCLFVGKQSRNKNILSVLSFFASIMGFSLFIKAYVKSISNMNVSIRNLFEQVKTSPTTLHLHQIRLVLSNLTRDAVLMETLLQYMSETLSSCKSQAVASPVVKDGTAGTIPIALFYLLKMKKKHTNLSKRLRDVKRLTKGACLKLQLLQTTVNARARQDLMITSKSIDINFDKLKKTTKYTKMNATSYKIIQLLFGASLSFDILDRVSGGDLLGAEGVEIANCSVCWVYEVFPLQKPMLWFAINMVWMLVFVVCLHFVFEHVIMKNETTMSITKIVNLKINVTELKNMLKKIRENRNVINDVTVGTLETLGAAKTAEKTINQRNNTSTTIFLDGLQKVILKYDKERELLLSLTLSWKENVDIPKFNDVDHVKIYLNRLKSVGVLCDISV